MAATPNDVLRMYLLMGISASNQAFLKQRFPNVTYVLEHPDPKAGNDATFNRDLFKSVDPNVYAAFHQYLKSLNNGSTTAPAAVEHTQLQGAYSMAGSMVTLADLAFAAPGGGAWPGGSQHPRPEDVSDLAKRLT